MHTGYQQLENKVITTRIDWGYSIGRVVSYEAVLVSSHNANALSHKTKRVASETG